MGFRTTDDLRKLLLSVGVRNLKFIFRALGGGASTLGVESRPQLSKGLQGDTPGGSQERHAVSVLTGGSVQMRHLLSPLAV